MTKEEYRQIRRGIGTWKYTAEKLGVDWRTIARREAGEIPVSPEAAAALRSLTPSWFAELPAIPTSLNAAPVVGCPGYAATRCGRVFSCRSKYPSKEFPYRDWFEIFATKGSRGYWVISLALATGRRQLKLHQVILRAYKGEPPENTQGRHLDDNPDHNYIDNLEWGTAKQNRADMIRNGGLPDRKGMKHPLVKLTDLDVAAIRARRQKGDKLRAIGSDFGVSEATVSLIANGKTWNHTK